MIPVAETLNHPYLSEYPINSDATAVVGKKGIGKTKETTVELQACIAGLRLTEPTPIIVFDVCDEYLTLPEIALNDIKNFHTIEMRRVRMYRDDGRRMTLDEVKQALIFVLDNFHNGILCIEEKIN